MRLYCNWCTFQYYECEHGQPLQRFCSDGLYYNPETELCDFPGNVNTNTCNTKTLEDLLEDIQDNDEKNRG